MQANRRGYGGEYGYGSWLPCIPREDRVQGSEGYPEKEAFLSDSEGIDESSDGRRLPLGTPGARPAGLPCLCLPGAVRLLLILDLG